MKAFLFSLLALSVLFLAESWVSPGLVTTTKTTRARSSGPLKDVIDGNLQWYAGKSLSTSTASNTVSKSAVDRQLRNAAERFMKFQSGYFSPLMPNDNNVEMNRRNNNMNNGYYSNVYGNNFRNDSRNDSRNNYNNGNSNNVEMNRRNNSVKMNRRNNNVNNGYNSNGYGNDSRNNYNNGNKNNVEMNRRNNSVKMNRRNNNIVNNGYNSNGYGNDFRNDPRNDYINGYNNNEFNSGYNNFSHKNDPSSILAEDFVFRSPVIGPLTKWDYIDSLDYFRVYEAFPDINPNCYGFAVDPIEPLKVRFFVKATGTYQNPLGGFLGSATSKLTPPDGRKYMGSTEAWSITFNDLDRMQVKAISAGYVVDRFEEDGRFCTTGGKGLVYGILNTIGLSLPASPGSTSLELTQWLTGQFTKNDGPDILFPKTSSDRRTLPQWWTDKRVGAKK